MAIAVAHHRLAGVGAEHSSFHISLRFRSQGRAQRRKSTHLVPGRSDLLGAFERGDFDATLLDLRRFDAWRAVASALDCSTDPRKPLTLGDAQKTPARLVTVHVAATAAAGTLKIDWTSGQVDDPAATRLFAPPAIDVN